VRVVDENVEMSQKISPKNSANVGIGGREMLEVLNDNQRVRYDPRADFEQVQLRNRSKRAETNADDYGSRALNLQVKFSRQRRINHRDNVEAAEDGFAGVDAADVRHKDIRGSPQSPQVQPAVAKGFRYLIRWVAPSREGESLGAQLVARRQMDLLQFAQTNSQARR
jgi:hypothetical protein